MTICMMDGCPSEGEHPFRCVGRVIVDPTGQVTGQPMVEVEGRLCDAHHRAITVTSVQGLTVAV